MPRKRPREPIAPTTIPGEATDPRIPDDDETAEEEQQARESEKAFDEAITRLPPG
jgi:hypothetical protein